MSMYDEIGGEKNCEWWGAASEWWWQSVVLAPIGKWGRYVIGSR